MVYTTHKNGDEWGMVYYCYTNIITNIGLDVTNENWFYACELRFVF